MRLLTIGAFARAARLSPKALRLYDELGLLPPAHVDRASGYRYYAPHQLDQARLVARLRRIGMPLATIRRVGTLDPAEAAREVRAFWAGVEADTAARRELAAFLVDQLSRKDPDMAPTTPPLNFRYAARSDRGLVRETNQDTVHAGSRLFAVADGFGSAGAPASAAAVAALSALETAGVPAGNLLGALEDAVLRADLAVRGATGSPADAGTGRDAGSGPGSGTTLTAMLWTGSRLALVHVGDSRAYVLRGGELLLITHDHTLVQSMVDEGRITPEEAGSHPRRSLLVRALGHGADAEPDMSLREALPGDRYLLCSDGLSTVVPTAEIRRVLGAAGTPGPTVRELIALANGSGGPDNVSCVVADVVAPQA